MYILRKTNTAIPEKSIIFAVARCSDIAHKIK